MEVQVATNDNFKAHQGFDVAAWKSDHTSPATPKAYRVLRSMTINDLLSLLAHELKVDPELCRPWLMVGRQNGTVRPDQPIEGLDLTCEEVTLKSGSKVPPLRLWLEQTTERDEAGSVIWNDVHLERNATTSNKPILLLLKHFNPDEQSLCGVTHFYASWQDKVADLYNPIVQLLGWPSGTSIKLYEVS